MGTQRAACAALALLLLLLPAAAGAGEPPKSEDREIPPERGRLYIDDQGVLKARLRDVLNHGLPLEKRFDALSLFVLTQEWSVVPELAKLARNEREPIALRVGLLWALGEIGDPRGMPALQYALSKILLDDPKDKTWRYEQGIEVEIEGKKRNVPLREMVTAQLARLGEPVVKQLAELIETPVSAEEAPEPEAETPRIGRMRAALLTLVAIGDRDPRALRAVLRVLTADDKAYPWDFKVIAAQGLSGLLLQRRDELARLQARDALGERVAKAFVEASIVSDAHQVREIAGWTLREVGWADRAGKQLVAILEVPNLPKGVRYRAIEALAFVQSRDEQVIDVLIFMLHHEDRNVRWRAAVALGATGDKRAVRFLRLLTRDEDSFVRTKAVAALGHLEDPTALPDLAVAMDDPDYRVRRQAALALGRLNVRSAVYVLVREGLKDPAPTVRQNTIIALGYMRSATGLKHVATMLGDPDTTVRLTAVEVLVQFTHKDTTKALITALADAESTVRDAAAAAVNARLQGEPKATIPLLVDLAATATGPARAAALRCLAADYQALKSRKDPVRQALYERLLRTPSSPLTAALLAALKDPAAACRAEAGKFLADLGWQRKDKALLAPVAALINDPDAAVRRVALGAKNFLSNLR